MELKDAIFERRSIRAFSDEPVSKSVVEDIMKTALWSPSWGNTQPWMFTIVGGQAMARIKEEYLERFTRGDEVVTDIKMPEGFNETQTARYKGLGKALFTTLGIQRGDMESRKEYYKKMTTFFDAPCVIYLHLEKGFNPYALLDGGLIMQNIALLAVEKGLGTCFLARSVHYPDVLRKHANIPEDRLLAMGIAVGHPIEDHPAGAFRSQRGDFDEFVQWVDMEG